MAVIDADAHVVESERTWDYLDGSDRRFRPTTVIVPDENGKDTEFWHIDGELVRKGPVDVDDMTRAVREMADLPSRLRHMDELGTDAHVLFPTIFLRPITERADIEIALVKAYNRWLVDIWKQEPKRLRWAVMLPFKSIEESLKELEFGKQNGACAVFMRGIEGNKLPSDPYFFPVYEAAQALDMPVCVHAATGNFAVHDLFPSDPGLWRFKVPGITAFHALLFQGVPQKFPTLRFGFIELSSQWVPYALHDLTRRFEKRGKIVDKKSVMRENRFYVACQTDDDIPYVLTYAGEGGLVMGTDYGHADTSSELEALRRLGEMPGVGPKVAAKILDDNPRALYSI